MKNKRTNRRRASTATESSLTPKTKAPSLPQSKKYYFNTNIHLNSPPTLTPCRHPFKSCKGVYGISLPIQHSICTVELCTCFATCKSSRTRQSRNIAGTAAWGSFTIITPRVGASDYVTTIHHHQMLIPPPHSLLLLLLS